MPVVVTGASGLVGRRVVAALAGTSPEVRAYVRAKGSVAALRAAGAKVAVGWIGDVDNLVAAMAGAHTVVHLVGGLDLPDEAAFREANLDSTRFVVEAARRAGISRFVFLSYPGADPGSANPYLRFKGMAEALISDSGLGFVVLRATHVYGPGSSWLEGLRQQAGRSPPIVLGSGRQVLAPVFVDDVAAVLAAVDDRAELRSGIWGLQGPDRVTADELADALGAGGGRKLHLGPRAATVLARLTGRRVSGAGLEVLTSDSLSDAPDAAAEFGVPLTSLSDGLAASTAVAPAEGLPE
jgi:uncharacterized protein YbjT (DUF2867 family)